MNSLATEMLEQLEGKILQNLGKDTRKWKQGETFEKRNREPDKLRKLEIYHRSFSAKRYTS